MLLDILEEHLEEAELLARRRDAALGSDAMDLAGLHTLELRLDAHLDALAITGGSVLSELGEDLGGSGGHVAFAWAAASLCTRTPSRREDVLRAARGASSPETTGVVSAWCYAPLDPSVRARLGAWVESADGSEVTAALEVLSFQRALDAVPMERFSRSPDPRVRAAAARAIGRMRRSDEGRALERLMRDPDPGIRDAALEAALLVRMPDTLARLRAIGDDERARTAEWLRLLASAGNRSDAEAIRTSLGMPHLGEAALSALATLGYGACAPMLVECMEDAAWARGAAVAFERITGIACPASGARPQSEQEEDDTFEDLRPIPDVPAVRRLWETRSADFDPGTRYRRGRPLRSEDWLTDPSRGSLQTRREELFRLWATSPKPCRDVPLDAPASRQRAARQEGGPL